MDWLEKTRSEGKKAFENKEWPTEADSPTQREYTPLHEFTKADCTREGKVSVKISAEGKATAVPLDEMSAKDLKQFQKLYATIIPSSGHKLTAFKDWKLQGGFYIHAPAGTKSSVEVSLKTDGIAGIHNLILAEEGAALEIYEKQEGNATLVSSATELIASKNSNVRYDYTQDYSGETLDFSVKRASVKQNAKLRWNTGFFGGKTSIASIDSRLEGEKAEALNYNSYLGSGKQQFDITTNSLHFVPHTQGELYSKGVLKDESQSTYRGVIYIDKPAFKTNCFMSGHALLLGDKARANSLPSLEILCTDVQSRHGATVDHIDPDKVFYLNTRGLDKKQAEELIVRGFVGEVYGKSEGSKAEREWEEKIEVKLNGR